MDSLSPRDERVIRPGELLLLKGVRNERVGLEIVSGWRVFERSVGLSICDRQRVEAWSDKDHRRLFSVSGGVFGSFSAP